VIRAVVDTNTIVSGVLLSGGASARILDAAHSGQFTLIVSAAIIDEVIRTLNRDRVRRRYRLTAHNVLATRRFLDNDAEVVALTISVQGVATHPEDDLILATAVSGQADYLVTWDTQLQKLGAYAGVTILSPPAFLEVLRASP
jgi:uncharacterized protein